MESATGIFPMLLLSDGNPVSDPWYDALNLSVKKEKIGPIDDKI